MGLLRTAWPHSRRMSWGSSVRLLGRGRRWSPEDPSSSDPTSSSSFCFSPVFVSVFQTSQRERVWWASSHHLTWASSTRHGHCTQVPSETLGRSNAQQKQEEARRKPGCVQRWCSRSYLAKEAKRLKWTLRIHVAQHT